MTVPSTRSSTAHAMLPHSVPASPDLRLALYAIRRMAAGGIGDAFAASAYLTAFGVHYRRPLVLMRTLMSEMARSATTRLLIAPCCCPRMSAGERAILDALAGVERNPEQTHAALSALLRVPSCVAVLDSTHAVAVCFADLGRPLDPAHDCI